MLNKQSRGPDPARAALDRVFQALADPTRRVMVERLSRGPAEPFEMSLPSIVQHLQVLEASGLIRSQKVGRVRTCRLGEAALGSAERWITERRATWERRLDRLGQYLDETAPEPEFKPKKTTQRRKP